MKRLFFAALALAASASISCAQSAPPVPDKPADANAAPAGSGTMSPRKGASGSITPAAVNLGWNNMHAYSCQTWRSSSTGYSVKMYSLSNEGVSITATGAAGIPFHAMMAAQCATGNWVSFYVTKKSGSSFTWSNMQTWSYK